jgi:AraC-like DNA-binding protein
MEQILYILYIGFTQSLFAALMIATKRNPQVADRILAAWLFLIAIEMGFALVNENIIRLYEFVFIPFTYGPLLYFYIRFLTNEEVKFHWTNWLHFIPFLLVFASAIVFRGKPVIRLDDFWSTDPFLSFRLIYGTSFFISVTTYSVIAFVLISRHQKNIQNLFSYTSERITLSWLKFVAISFYVTYILVFILGVFVIFNKESLPYNPTFVSYFGLTLFAFAFSVYGFKQPGIFHELYARSRTGRREVIEEKKAESKYERSGLKKEDAEEYRKRLLRYMKDKKPYLDGDLTIQDISEQLDIPRHHLTQVINETLYKNFYTFINEYRVEEVKKMLTDPEYQKYTLTSIAFEAGFNSKSSFNSVFKDLVGKTPTQFREENNLLQQV